MSFDRRMREDARPTRAVLITWAVIAAALSASAWTYIAQGRFPGPDDVLRLVQVRDLLAGQGWWDVTQYRIDPPGGVPMHWSRLVDAPLALLILLFEPWTGAAQAEFIAAIVMPLALLLLLMLVVARLAWRLFDTRTAILSLAALAFAPAVLSQAQPLRIDHHAWQIACVGVALWSIAWRRAARGGAVAGGAMAAGVLISLEMLPMAAAFAIVLALRWAIDHRARSWLVAYMQALGGVLTLLVAVFKGPGVLAPWCDAIAVPHLGFFLIAAVGTSIIGALPRLPLLTLALLFAIVAGLGVGFVAWSNPQCLTAPFGTLDPLVHEIWYRSVREGMPVWQLEADRAVAAIVQSLVALAATIVLCLKSRDWLRQWWLEYAILLALAIAAGFATARSIAFAGVIGAIPLGWAASSLWAAYRQGDTPAKRVGAFAGIFLALMPGKAAAAALTPAFEAGGLAITAPTAARDGNCDLSANAERLATLPPSLLFSNLDIGPGILIETPHSVVATGHHRANLAMRDIVSGFTGSTAEARSVVERREADYVVLCEVLAETQLLAQVGGQDSFVADLLGGRVPAWLEEVDLGTGALRVWRVRRDGNPSPPR